MWIQTLKIAYPLVWDTHSRTIDTTLATVIGKVITDTALEPKDGILHHYEGVDLLPANIELLGIEISLVNGYIYALLHKCINIVLQSVKNLCTTAAECTISADAMFILSGWDAQFHAAIHIQSNIFKIFWILYNYGLYKIRCHSVTE